MFLAKPKLIQQFSLITAVYLGYKILDLSPVVSLVQKIESFCCVLVMSFFFICKDDILCYPSFGGIWKENRVFSMFNVCHGLRGKLFLDRMCLQCGIPKTYSNARGMVCPVCGDRPPADPSNETKKKGSTVKDKEKSKRMKGQSSHATWKSETEMQLRQQFD